MPLSAAMFLLILVARISSKTNPYNTLIVYENNQRLSAQIKDNQFHLLSFRLSDLPQHFIQAPLYDESISVEVVVHWISNNSLLQNPEFDLSQKVRLVIEQQDIGTAPKRSILTKQFLTQTGFKLQLKGGCSYRWKIQSSGKIEKLVKIALLKKPTNNSYFGEDLKQNHKNEVQILREMSMTLQSAKYLRSQRQQKKSQSQVANLWAWMSGIEIASILGVLLVQLALFQKFILPTSVV